MAAPWRGVFPGTWTPSDAAFFTTPPGMLVSEAMLGPADSAASLSLSATEGADLCASAVALVAASADLSLAATEGADLASATARLAVSANLAGTEGADTASGAVAAVVSAALSATEGADTAASNVSLLITASMAAVEGADICASAVDLVSAGVDMALDATEGADICESAVDLVADEATTDHQVFRIYNVRKRKKTKIRHALVLDMDVSGVPEREETPVPKPIQAQIIPSGKPLKVTALDRLIMAPIQIRVRPKPVLRAPILPLIVQSDVEEERKTRRNKTIRLLLLAS